MTAPIDSANRRRWMGLLARADESDLERWRSSAEVRAFTWMRPPETGLVMIRARAGATAERFNLGEMTVTRCTLRIDDGPAGVAYVAGRSHRHAENAALADALLQVPATRSRVETELVAPLAQREAQASRSRERKAAATRVEFFTLARRDG